MEDLKKIVEASLFMAPGLMKLEEIAKVSKSTVPEVRVALNELVHEYSERDTALTIEESETGFRMKVKEQFEPSVGHMANLPQFNKSVMKTLAYISYKQPVKQAEVIKFRNNKAYEHISLLKEKGFIKKTKVGSTFIIQTTKKFLQYFGKAAEKKGLFGKEQPVSEQQLTAEELKHDLGIEGEESNS